jgi:hypothetical protein
LSGGYLDCGTPTRSPCWLIHPGESRLLLPKEQLRHFVGHLSCWFIVRAPEPSPAARERPPTMIHHRLYHPQVLCLILILLQDVGPFPSPGPLPAMGQQPSRDSMSNENLPVIDSRLIAHGLCKTSIFGFGRWFLRHPQRLFASWPPNKESRTRQAGWLKCWLPTSLEAAASNFRAEPDKEGAAGLRHEPIVGPAEHPIELTHANRSP